MRLFSGGQFKASSAEHKRAVFAMSVLLHLAVVAWLMTRPNVLAKRHEASPPLLTFDLPQRELVTIKVPQASAIVEIGPSGGLGGGGSAGQPASAMLKRPDSNPAPIDVPLPVIALDVPSSVPLAAAPVDEPVPVPTSGPGTGSGMGEGAKGGSGTGNGSQIGSAQSDGRGTGMKGGTGTGSGTAAGLLQPAEWIVRPTDERMRHFYPWDARMQGISGTVRLSCRVKAKRARDCRVLSETPERFGFGVSAIAAVRTGWIKAPIAGDGDPEKIRVSVLISFDQTD